MLSITLITIFTALLLPGLLATIMMLPGVPYMFVVALLYSLANHFISPHSHYLTGANIAVLVGVTLITLIVDQLAGFIAAKWGGAQGKTFLFGITGVIIGTFVLPLFGGLIGLFVGILVGELIRRHQGNKNASNKDASNKEETIKNSTIHLVGSLKAAGAGVIGSLTGIIIDLCLGITFIVLFMVFILK